MRTLFTVFSLFLITVAYAQNDFSISYVGYYQDATERNSVKLEFELKNLTSDTLYISNDDFKLSVLKKGKLLKEESVNYGIGSPFIRPRINICPEIIDTKGTLAKTYAKKVVEKVNLKQEDTLDAIDEIYNKLIILLPKETFYKMYIFRHKDFDKNCLVKMDYNNSNTFKIHLSDENKSIQLKR